MTRHRQVRAWRCAAWMATLAAAVLCAAALAFADVAQAAETSAAPVPRWALVVQDNVPLRAAPGSAAAPQALLWQGDLLEVRGERLEQLQVWDHRRERGGFVRASQVRLLSFAPEEAPQLLAVLRFLRDTPGAESLGIAYAAAYLKAAPAEAIDAEPFDAIGTLAERLARRASSTRLAPAQQAAVAGHLEAVAGYGVVLSSREQGGRMRLCYDGEAWRRVLASRPAPEQQARALLGLTRADCIDPTLPATQRRALDEEAAQALSRHDTTQLPQPLKNRVLMRRAGAWATLVHERSRQGQDSGAAQAAEQSLQALAAVEPASLTDEDKPTYTEAAVRANASRWAAERDFALKSRLVLALAPGQPGQTCVSLVDQAKALTLVQRCTYAVVWPQSLRIDASARRATLAVQPLPAWRELWVFRQERGGWTVEVLPPATGEPELGVVEFAGWVPGTDKLLVAREARVDGRFQRRFEVLRGDTLTVEKSAERPEALSSFYRWQDVAWKRQTTMLR
jgi:hypothetical protein